MDDHYHYVAVRRGDHWATTAAGSRSTWGISEQESWSDLSGQVSTFEVATTWDQVVDRDPRIGRHRKVIRFTVASIYVAAILIREPRRLGEWFTTLTREQHESLLPDVDIGNWPEIHGRGSNIQVVTSWTDLEGALFD